MRRLWLPTAIVVTIVCVLGKVTLTTCPPTPKAREAVLRIDLATFRDVLRDHHRDLGRYPERLEDLVVNGYLRMIPVDPMTKSAETWVVVRGDRRQPQGITNVRSGALANGSNGLPYRLW